MRRPDRARLTEPGRVGQRNGIWKPITSVLILVLCIHSSDAIPINRQVGISENVFITVQNDTYGNEQRVCSIDSVTYEDGDSIPTSSPCEHCICRPPGFACTIISCEYRPGCKALKRSNQCCPEYQCECEKDGKIYQNGEKILDNNNPCEVCYCQGGDVICAVIDCYWRSDCQPRYIENRCCPLYDHCPPPRHPGPIRPIHEITSTTMSSTAGWFNWTVPTSTLAPIVAESTTTERLTTTTTLATTTPAASTTQLTSSSTEAPASDVVQNIDVASEQPSSSSTPDQLPEHQSTESLIPAEAVPSSSPATIIPSPSTEIDVQQGQKDAEPIDRVVVNQLGESPVPVITFEAPVASSESPASESPILSSESPAANLIPDSQPEEVQVVSQSTTVLPDLSPSIESGDQGTQSDVQPSQTESIQSTASSAIVGVSDADVQKLPLAEETQTSDLSPAEQLPLSIQSSVLESSLSSQDLEHVNHDQPTEILESASISTTIISPSSVAIESTETESINSTPTLSTSTESTPLPVYDSAAPSQPQQDSTSQPDIASDQAAPTELSVEVATAVHDDVVTEQPVSSSTAELPSSPVPESSSNDTSSAQDSPSVPVPSIELQPPYNPEVESQNEISANDGIPADAPPKPSLELLPPKVFNNEIFVPDDNVNNALPEILSQTKPVHETHEIPTVESQPGSVEEEQKPIVSATESQILLDESSAQEPQSTDAPSVNEPLPEIVRDQVQQNPATELESATEVSSDDASSQGLEPSTQVPIAQAAQDAVQDAAQEVTTQSPQSDSPAPTDAPAVPVNVPETEAGSELVLADEQAGPAPTVLPILSDAVPDDEVEVTTEVPQNVNAPLVQNDQTVESTSTPLDSVVQNDPSEGATTVNVFSTKIQAEDEPLADAVAEVTTDSPVQNDAQTEGYLNDDGPAPTTPSTILSDESENEQALPTTIPFADEAAVTTINIEKESNAEILSDEPTGAVVNNAEKLNEETKIAPQEKIESGVEALKETVHINEEQVVTTVAPLARDDKEEDTLEDQTTSNYPVARDDLPTESAVQNDEEVTTPQPLQNNVVLADQGDATESPVVVKDISEEAKLRLDPSVFKEEVHDGSEQLSSVTELGLAQNDEAVVTTTPVPSIQNSNQESTFNDEASTDNQVVFDNVQTHTTTEQAEAELKGELIVRSEDRPGLSDAEPRETTEINGKSNEELQDGLTIELTTAGPLGEGRKDLDSFELTEETPSGVQDIKGSTGASPSNSESEPDSANVEKVADDEVGTTTENISLLRHHHPDHEFFGVEEATTRLPQEQVLADDKSENNPDISNLDVTTVLNDGQDEEATTIRQKPDFRSGLDSLSLEDVSSDIDLPHPSPSHSQSPSGSVASGAVPEGNSANLDNFHQTATGAPELDDPAGTTVLPESFDDVGSTPLSLFAKNEEIINDNIPETTSAPLNDNTSQPEILNDNTPQPDTLNDNTPVPEILHDNTAQPEILHDNTAQPEILNDNTAQPEILNDNTAQPEIRNNNTPQPEALNDDTVRPEIELVEKNDEISSQETLSTARPEPLNDNTSPPEILADDVPAVTTGSPLADDPVVSTTLESKVNETEQSSSSVRTVVLPDVLKKLDPISDDLAQFRHDLPMHNQFKTEVNGADDTWYWRTLNRVRRLPQFLKTLSRQPRATESNEPTKPTKGKKAYSTVKHKKHIQRPFLFW